MLHTIRGQKPKTSTTLPYSTHQLGHLASHPHCSDPYHDGLLACCGLRVLAFWIAYLVALWTPCSPCKLKPISVKDSQHFASRSKVHGPQFVSLCHSALPWRSEPQGSRMVCSRSWVQGFARPIRRRIASSNLHRQSLQGQGWRLASVQGPWSRSCCPCTRSCLPLPVRVQAYFEGHYILGGSAQTGQAKIVQGHAEGCRVDFEAAGDFSKSLDERLEGVWHPQVPTQVGNGCPSIWWRVRGPR